jgi:hypothetical protein
MGKPRVTTRAASLSAWFDDGFGSKPAGRQPLSRWPLSNLQRPVSLGGGNWSSCPEAEINDRRKHRAIRIPWMLESGISAGMMASSAQDRFHREQHGHAEIVDP